LRDPALSATGGPGPLVAPGKYKVALFQRASNVVTKLAEPIEFNVVLDTLGTPSADDVKEQVAFHRQVTKLRKAATAAGTVATETGTKLEAIRQALDNAPKADDASKTAVREMIARNRDILRALRGDTELRRRNENTPISIVERIRYALDAGDEAFAKPTATAKQQYEIAAKEFGTEYAKLKQLVEVDLPALEKKLDGFGAPLTPGRLPAWDDKK
jgi:phage shock protein A